MRNVGVRHDPSERLECSWNVRYAHPVDIRPWGRQMDQAELDRELMELKARKQAQRAQQERERQDLLFTLKMALRTVPAGFFRELGKPRVGDGEIASKVVAEAVLKQLELSGYAIVRKRVPDENGRLVDGH